MKFNFISKLFLAAVFSVALYSCSNDDDQIVATKKLQTEVELMAKGQDSMPAALPGEPLIPKPRG